MKIFSLILLSLILASSVRAADVVQNLPAGGSYVFQTNWDKYTINCTASPVTPSVLSQSCACEKYFESGPSNWRFTLTAKILLSDGSVKESRLASGLESIDACHLEKKEYANVCNK